MDEFHWELSEEASEEQDEGQRSTPAGFLMRAAAFLIDACLLLLMNCALVGLPLLAAWHYTTFDLRGGLLGLMFFSLFCLISPLLLSFLYYTVLHAFGGQTLGKVFLGIRVIGREADSISLGTSFLRWCARFLSILPFGLGYLWALLDPQKATLHDRIAATRLEQL
jgi:uncharacterized RDD family membrane protein YckC